MSQTNKVTSTYGNPPMFERFQTWAQQNGIDIKNEQEWSPHWKAWQAGAAAQIDILREYCNEQKDK